VWLDGSHLPPDAKLKLALAMVVEDAGGALSYWALNHAGGKPDFHHASGFILELDPIRGQESAL